MSNCSRVAKLESIIDREGSAAKEQQQTFYAALKALLADPAAVQRALEWDNENLQEDDTRCREESNQALQLARDYDKEQIWEAAEEAGPGVLAALKALLATEGEQKGPESDRNPPL